MSGDESTIKLLEEMKKQMSDLQGQVERMQCMGTSASFEDPGEEEDLPTGELVELLEQTRTFLEAAFSATLSNADRKKLIANIGIPDCNKICCQKLDPMLTTTFAERHHKGGRLSFTSAAILVRCRSSSNNNPRGCRGRRVDTAGRVFCSPGGSSFDEEHS